MKDLIIYLSVGIISVIIAAFFLCRYFVSKIKKLKQESNLHILQRIHFLDLSKYLDTNRLLNSLCFLRREYVRNEPFGIVDSFDNSVYNLLCEFINRQTDAITFHNQLTDHVMYLDSDFEDVIVSVVVKKQQEITALFEETYHNVKDTQSLEMFKFAVKCRYFSKIKLDYIFYERLKTPSNMTLEEV